MWSEEDGIGRSDGSCWTVADRRDAFDNREAGERVEGATRVAEVGGEGVVESGFSMMADLGEGGDSVSDTAEAAGDRLSSSRSEVGRSVLVAEPGPDSSVIDVLDDGGTVTDSEG